MTFKIHVWLRTGTKMWRGKAIDEIQTEYKYVIVVRDYQDRILIPLIGLSPPYLYACSKTGQNFDR